MSPAFAQTGKHETILHRHEAAPAKPVAPPADTAPDAGDINGDVYTNQFFGFRYTLPQSLTTVTDVMEGQEDLEQRAYVLLSLQSEAAPEARAAALVIAADKQPPAAAAANWSTAYLQRVAEIAAKQGGTPVGSTREYHFGGSKFFRLDFRHVAPTPGFQSTVLTSRRGYALVFNFAAPTQEQIDALVQSLSTLQFSR